MEENGVSYRIGYIIANEIVQYNNEGNYNLMDLHIDVMLGIFTLSNNLKKCLLLLQERLKNYMNNPSRRPSQLENCAVFSSNVIYLNSLIKK